MQGFLADRRIRISQRPVLVDLVLKHVRVNRPRPESVVAGKVLYMRHVAHTLGKIPKDMQCDCGTDTCPSMHLAGIAELFFRASRRGGLEKFSETRAGIGKTPRRQFDMKGIKGR